MLIDSYCCRLVLIDGHKLATLWPNLENAPGTLHWWSATTSSDVLLLLFVIVIAWIALYTVLRWIALFVQLLHCVTIAPHRDLLPFLHNSSILCVAMFLEICDNCTWFINHKFTFGVYLNSVSNVPNLGTLTIWYPGCSGGHLQEIWDLKEAILAGDRRERMQDAVSPKLVAWPSHPSSPHTPSRHTLWRPSPYTHKRRCDWFCTNLRIGNRDVLVSSHKYCHVDAGSACTAAKTNQENIFSAKKSVI